MPVSHDLQDVISDVSAAIAERKTFGRTELERLRRNLNAIARAQSRQESASATTSIVLGEVLTGIDKGVVDLARLSASAQQRVEQAAA